MGRKPASAVEEIAVTEEGVIINNDYRYQQQVNFWNRDSYGLLPQVEYPFKEDEPNKIDWKKLIPLNFIVPNKDRFKDVDLSTLDVSTLKDNQQLILLGGFRYLVGIRGYNYIKQNIKFASETFVATECEIEFIPNYETGMRSIIFTGEGDAHIGNTNDFSKHYLTCIAANRAFVRAVRNALDIPVLGQDEIGGNFNTGSDSISENSDVSPVGPHAALISKLKSKGRTFDQLKSKLLKEGYEESLVMSWVKETDVPVNYVIKILGILSK
jgi:hypothetical protein